MSDHFWLTQAQIERLKPYFPRSHGVPRVDDRRVLSGIIHVLKRGLQWRDAPAEYGPHKTLYNRFKHWSEMGVFNNIFIELSSEHTPEQLQIPSRGLQAYPCRAVDATHLKAHRTAFSLLKKGAFPAVLAAQKAG